MNHKGCRLKGGKGARKRKRIVRGGKIPWGPGDVTQEGGKGPQKVIDYAVMRH